MITKDEDIFREFLFRILSNLGNQIPKHLLAKKKIKLKNGKSWQWLRDATALSQARLVNPLLDLRPFSTK